jgi:hypothetical protein
MLTAQQGAEAWPVDEKHVRINGWAFFILGVSIAILP